MLFFCFPYQSSVRKVDLLTGKVCFLCCGLMGNMFVFGSKMLSELSRGCVVCNCDWGIMTA